MKIIEFAEHLSAFNSVLLFCHCRPDGDTLGSALAIKKALEYQGKKVDIVCESDIPEKYNFLLDGYTVFKYSTLTDKYEAHLAVDCSTENMLGENWLLFKSCPNNFNIDHHVSNTKYAKFNYVDATGACAEIVYQLLEKLNCKFDKAVSDRLLLGLVTDTGNFSQSNTTSQTLDIASKLVKAGGDVHDINYRMFKNQKKQRALLYASVMSNIKFYLDDKLAIISISQSDLDKFGLTSDVTEGFIDFPLSIEGVEVAVSVLENKPKNYKISYRSKGRVNVNEIASVFGGGGHIMASGSVICGFYEDVIEKLVRTVSLYL